MMSERERVTTLDYSENGIRCGYIFQSIVFNALSQPTLRELQVKTQKLVKQFKLNRLAYKEISEDVWEVDIEIDYSKENQFTLRIDRSKSFRDCCTFLYKFNNQAEGQKKGSPLDVFNVKFLTEEEQKEAPLQEA